MPFQIRNFYQQVVPIGRMQQTLDLPKKLGMSIVMVKTEVFCLNFKAKCYNYCSIEKEKKKNKENIRIMKREKKKKSFITCVLKVHKPLQLQPRTKNYITVRSSWSWGPLLNCVIHVFCKLLTHDTFHTAITCNSSGRKNWETPTCRAFYGCLWCSPIKSLWAGEIAGRDC